MYISCVFYASQSSCGESEFVIYVFVYMALSHDLANTGYNKWQRETGLMAVSIGKIEEFDVMCEN